VTLYRSSFGSEWLVVASSDFLLQVYGKLRILILQILKCWIHSMAGKRNIVKNGEFRGKVADLSSFS